MSIFKLLILSCYSPKDIAKQRLKGVGKAILYIFILTLISVLPAAYHLTNGINKGLHEAKEMIVEDVPPFSISKGTLHTSANTPVIIPKDGFTFVMDGSGKLNTTNLDDYSNALVLLQHKAVIISNHQPQSFDYTMLEGMNITDQEIKTFIKTFQSMLPVLIPLMILFMYLLSAATKFIEVTFFAFIALILKNILARNLKFRHIWAMSAYSITLSTLFFTIMDLFLIAVPYGVFVTWLVNMTIMYLALKEIPKPKSKSDIL